jgi:O-antigen/teichoic acid export membrane protein
VRGDELPALVSDALQIALWQTPIVLAGAIAVWLTMPDRWAPLAAPLACVLATFVILFPLRLGPAILQGLQDLAFLSRLQLLSWSLGTAVSVGLVAAGFGLSALAAGWIAGQLITSVAALLRLRLTFRDALPKRLRPMGWQRARAYFARGGWVSLSQIAQALLNGTDLLIIGLVLGPVPVVMYACTGKLVAVLANQPQVLTQAAAPALAELRTGGTAERLRDVSAALTQAMLFISGLIVVAVLASNGSFVAWWVGPQQFGGIGLTGLLLAVMLLRHWSTTMVYTLFAFGRERRIALTSVSDGLVTTASAFLLVRTIGIEGAPLGSLIGVCSVSLPFNIRALRRDLGVSLPQLFAWWDWGWRFLVVAAAALALAFFVTAGSFAQAAAAAGAAGATYVALTFKPVLASPLGPFVAAVIPAWTRRFVRMPGAPARA